jgi:hypothetical protein
MSSSRIMVALVGIGAFVAGIWVGVFISSPSAQRTSADISVTHSHSSPTAMNEKSVGSEDTAAKTGTSHDSDTPAEKFWTTLTIGDDRERQAAWFTMLSSLTATNAPEIRELFRKMDAHGRWFVPEWDAFWSRWGEVDGPAALEEVKATGSADYQPTLAEKILKGWATKDPQGAKGWLAANTSSPWYDGALRGYLAGLSRIDLDRATQDALTLARGRSVDGLSETLTEQALKQRQLSGMLEWWKSLPEDTSDVSLRRQAIGDVYQRLQVANDPRAGEWLAELAGTPFRPNDEIGRHAAKIASTDPLGAVAWVASLPPSPSDGHYTGIGRTIKALAGNDPAAVETWLAKLPPSALRDQALAAYADHLDGKSQTDAAQKWRSQVENQQLLRSNRAAGEFSRAFQPIELQVRPSR